MSRQPNPTQDHRDGRRLARLRQTRGGRSGGPTYPLHHARGRDPNEFADTLRALIGAAEDDGLERPELIAGLLSQVDEAGPAVEAGPDGFVEAVGLLLVLADAAGLDHTEVGAMLLEHADAMREAEAE